MDGLQLNSSVVPPTILFFGNDWSAENRTSSHQIARWLAKRYQVFYLECPGLRAPKSSGRDLKKIWSKLVRYFRGPRAVPEGLTVWTLLQLPLHRFRIVRALNRTVIRSSLRWLMWRRRIRNPITWFMIPHLPAIAGKIGERLCVYYCIDDYASLPDVNESAVRSMDEEMTRNANLVFVAAETLLASKRCQNPNTHVSPHGVDLEHFARARADRATPPADIAGILRPIVGFLVDYLAGQRPQWQFVMIGRVAVPSQDVPQRANIHFLGARSYDTLPDYGCQFDVAIIPYRLTKQVINANPIKLREYLAMGKPIVSVSTPEIDKYSDVVRIARSKEDFLAYLDALVASPPSSAEIAAFAQRVEPESWDTRLRAVMNIVSAYMNELPNTARITNSSITPSAAT
jgi:glycosyltransferase involved in cell wall biosynthesis